MEHFVAVFDNDDDDKLGLLKSEENVVADCMTTLTTKAGWVTTVRGNMGGKSLAELLMAVRDEMTVFHFSGHHGHNMLQMADGKVDASPLINFLNDRPKLKVVFINGCDSQNFVDKLVNVPIVIGTFKPIIDDYAKDVSAFFYDAIAKDPDKFSTPESIDQLFTDARNAANMQPGAASNASRGLVNWDDGRPAEDVYMLKINRNAPEFDNRFVDAMNVDVHEQFWDHVQKLEQKIGYREIGQGEFYKVYPYLFSQLLSDLKPELSVRGGIARLKSSDDLSTLSKLSFDRCVAIFELHYQLITFLKFAAFSILWTLHNRKVQDITQLSGDDKQVLRDQLSHHYYGPAMVNAEYIDHLQKMYGMIKFDSLDQSEKIRSEEAEVWRKLKGLVDGKLDKFKVAANLVSSFTSAEAQDNKSNWLTAENVLVDFVSDEAFDFLRNLNIWSIYDIYYRQFRYREEKELVFKRGMYPVATRPVESISDEDTQTIKPDDPIDYDIQSIYLVENNVRVLNLTPFYADMYASDENANKMDICYLEAFRKNMNLNYISLMDREEWHEVKKERESDERKFIYDQVSHFWTLISN